MKKSNHNSEERRNKQSGFNLIELLVVISVIALLVSAALLLFNSSRQKSRDAKRVADAKQIIAALDLYFTHCNSYPRYASGIEIGTGTYMALYTGNGNVVTGPCGTNGGSSTANGGFGTTANAEAQTGQLIIRQLRPAPTPADSATCLTGNNNSYFYTSTNDPSNSTVATGYTLRFCLGNATGGYPAGLNTITR